MLRATQSIQSIITTLSTQSQYTTRTSKSKIRFRYILAILSMIGMASVATVEITFNVVIDGIEASVSTELKKNQKLILSSYYWGCCLLGLPGGRLAELYSAKWIIFFGNAVNLIIHMSTPHIILLDNIYVLIGSRVFFGLMAGITYPAMIVLVARWSPPAERFILCGIVFAGIFFGYSTGIFLSLLILSNMRWENSFYLSGASLSLWLIFHGVYMNDYPRIRKGLTNDELDYLTLSLSDVLYDKKDVRKSRIPWKSILKSAPFYALLIVHTCTNLIFLLIRDRIANDVENFVWLRNMNKISQAVLVASPFFWGAVVAFLVGMVFSTLNQNQAISRPAAIRFVVAIGLLTPVVCLLVDYFVKSDWELVIKPMIIIMLAALNNMVQSNHIEISPNYAGTLMGITNSVSCIWGMIIVYLLPEDTIDHTGLIPIYGITAGCSMISLLVYILFLSDDVQKWNWNLKETKKSKPKKIKKIKVDKNKGRYSFMAGRSSVDSRYSVKSLK